MYVPGFRTRASLAVCMMAVLSSKEALAVMGHIREGGRTQFWESETLKPVRPSVVRAVGICSSCAVCWFPPQLSIILIHATVRGNTLTEISHLGQTP